MKLEHTFEVPAPPERVWQVMSDVERWHEWTPSITGIRRFGRGPFAVGSRALVRQPKLPPALWTVTDLQPGREFTWVSVAPGLRVAGIHRAEPAPGGTRATLSVVMSGWFARPWWWLTEGITRRYVGWEAEGLKARCEGPLY